MSIDWQAAEVQAIFVGERSFDLIKREDCRALIGDLNNGYMRYLPAKCLAPMDVWSLYTHMKIVGLDHCRSNGYSRVKTRKLKEVLREKTFGLYARLMDDSDLCADIVGNGLDEYMLDESGVMEKLVRKHERTDRYKGPWKSITYILYNFYMGDVMLLAGLSNTGKTSFALQCTYFAGYRTLYFGVDMSIEALGERILKTLWYKNHIGTFDGDMRVRCDKETEHLVKSGQATIPNGIRVYNSDTMTLEQIEYTARNEMEHFKAEFLIIDYAGRIDVGNDSAEQWREEQKIARAIKGMTKRLGVRTIALAQFNAKAEKFKKPEMSWISGSKEFISAVDVVVTLWQDKASDGTIDYTHLNLSDDVKNRDSGTHGDFVLDQCGTWLYEDMR